MHTSYNLYLRIFGGAENYPDRLALTMPGKSFTYGQLQERVAQAAAAFSMNGIDRRVCVALDTRKSLPALTAALALSFLGCKWLFASREALNNPLLFITHIVQDGPHHLNSRYKIVTMDEAWHSGDVPAAAPAHQVRPYANGPDDILVICQSSGTTGDAKFFPITAETAIRRLDPKYLLDPSPLPVVASMFNVAHAGIYLVTLRALAKGGTLVFGTDQGHWREAGVTLVLASQMHLAQLFEKWGGGRFARVWLAGSPLHPAFLDRALNHFEEVLNAYGAGEAGIVCYLPLRNRVPEGETISVGTALDGIVVEVVDDTGKPVKEGDTGEIRYRSPLLATGYIGDSAATRVSFRDGWFHPGDTGYFNSRKELFITGRVNDLVNIGGTKLNAAAIDGIIQSIPGIGDGACFTEPGPLGFDQLSIVVVAMSAESREKIAGELLKKLTARFRSRLLPASIYFAEAIPRNDNGKVLRGMARKKAKSGDWRQVTPAKD